MVDDYTRWQEQRNRIIAIARLSVNEQSSLLRELIKLRKGLEQQKGLTLLHFLLDSGFINDQERLAITMHLEQQAAGLRPRRLPRSVKKTLVQIRRFERCDLDPSLTFLGRYAAGLGKWLHVTVADNDLDARCKAYDERHPSTE